MDEASKDQFTIDNFFSQYPQYQKDREIIGKALSYVSENQERRLRIIWILAKNNLDTQSLICAILKNTNPAIEDEVLQNEFSAEIFNMVRTSEKISALKFSGKTLQQCDAIRKMIFALAYDIRVIIVELAEKLDDIRQISESDPAKQKTVAQETIEIWAPLANRLGMSSEKVELEDLSLKYLNSEAYHQIQEIVRLESNERTEYLEKAQDQILKKAAKANINVTVTKRAKHFYSIYQKMKKRQKSAAELYDLLAMRIICETKEECYILIGLVHSLWKPMEGRFKDYIAMPKANGYQSLHTTVMCEGNPLEIQIRTKEMHSIAEHGVASHWLYKKGTNKDSVKAENLSVVNQLKEMKSSDLADEAFFEKIKNEILGKSIYVFTPQGDVKELPEGSTAIDFAYAVHSKVGETITGAKANGAIIPLSQALKNTQTIEVLTSQKAHPTSNQLEFVKTPKARSKIHGWLQSHGLEEAAKPKEAGPNVVSTPQEGIAQAEMQARNKELKEKAKNNGVIKIKVGETSNYLVSLAHCCNPQPGDEIIGYVSRGRGIIVHKVNCPNFAHIPNIDVRNINVEWDE
ncbi:MAG: HD domain-containing protein [Treponemataceae bacterium]|nr:HD domain-containing protein [Treponemataceae bacterium]